MMPARQLGGAQIVSVGAPLPAFTLPNTSGGATRLWDFKQRRPVFLALLQSAESSDYRRWLASLIERRGAFGDLDVAVLLVLPEPIERLRALQTSLDLPYTFLSDERGEVRRRYVVDSADAIVVSDRYLQCLGVWQAASVSELPALDEPLTLLLAADQEDCGCGLPAWPEGWES